MKIGIVTQPLLYNYGGILQNYALQQILIQLGHEPITFDQVDNLAPLYKRIGSRIKRLFKKSKYKSINNIDLFKQKHIISTHKAKYYFDFKYFDFKYKPNAYIVGSDQVWRPKYNYRLFCNFLNFTKNKKKLSYAASFGTDVWEFSEAQTEKCKKLLSKFTHVSVREKSAVELCKSYFCKNATMVLDPTMVLNLDYYNKFITSKKDNDYVFTYILNSNIIKQNFINELTQTFGHEIAYAFDSNGNNFHKSSIEEWLTGIKNSKIVVCDSFHGVAFSIIFNKPFWVFTNPQRGNTRITSLLETFNLTNQLITDVFQSIHLKEPNINWDNVNSILAVERNKSLEFLKLGLHE